LPDGVDRKPLQDAALSAAPRCMGKPFQLYTAIAGVLIANVANKAKSIHNFAIALHLNLHLTSTQSS